MADSTADTSQLIIFSGDAVKIKAEIVRQGIALYEQQYRIDNGIDEAVPLSAEQSAALTNEVKIATKVFTSIAGFAAQGVIDTASKIDPANPDFNTIAKSIGDSTKRNIDAILGSVGLTAVHKEADGALNRLAQVTDAVANAVGYGEVVGDVIRLKGPTEAKEVMDRIKAMQDGNILNAKILEISQEEYPAYKAALTPPPPSPAPEPEPTSPPPAPEPTPGASFDMGDSQVGSTAKGRQVADASGGVGAVSTSVLLQSIAGRMREAENRVTTLSDNVKRIGEDALAAENAAGQIGTIFEQNQGKPPLIDMELKTATDLRDDSAEKAQEAQKKVTEANRLKDKAEQELAKAKEAIEEARRLEQSGEETEASNKIDEARTHADTAIDASNGLAALTATVANVKNDVQRNITTLNTMIKPPEPAKQAPSAPENPYYTKTKASFTGSGSSSLNAIYEGFKKTDSNADELLIGLSDPEKGKVAQNRWKISPEFKDHQTLPNYLIPGNPQGAIAAALEAAIAQEQGGQSQLRQFLQNVPLLSQGAGYVDPTRSDYVASQGLDNVSRIIYEAGLEGFKEAGLDPNKKYTTEQLQAATRTIAGKIRAALVNENSSSNDITVVNGLTGINSNGDLENEYGVNLAGVYQALLTSQYGTAQAQASFAANTKTQAEADKAKAATTRSRSSGAASAGATTGLLGVYAALTNDPGLTDQLVQIAESNDPEAIAKIATAIGQGGALARQISERMKKEAGLEVTFAEAQRFVDKVAAPAIYEVLKE
ncbi:MAG: hypothetical protein U1E36_02080 [Rickettsiales bacterium]